MSETAPITTTYGFSADPAPASKVNAATLDAVLTELRNTLNSLLGDLDNVQRDDNALADECVRLFALHQEVIDFITNTTGVFPVAACRLVATTNLGLSGLSAIDGVTPIAGDRILVVGQTTASQNGVYVAAAGAWSRATDADATGDLVYGSSVYVEAGATQTGTQWMVGTTGTITIGTTSITWIKYRASPATSIADGSITTAKLADLAITTAKLADLAVTTAKIADANITTAKIADLNVTTGKIAALAVTTAKIALAAVGAAQLDGTVSGFIGGQTNPSAANIITQLGSDTGKAEVFVPVTRTAGNWPGQSVPTVRLPLSTLASWLSDRLSGYRVGRANNKTSLAETLTAAADFGCLITAAAGTLATPQVITLPNSGNYGSPYREVLAIYNARSGNPGLVVVAPPGGGTFDGRTIGDGTHAGLVLWPGDFVVVRMEGTGAYGIEQLVRRGPRVVATRDTTETGATSYTPLSHGTEVLDLRGNYDPATDTFTAPVGGLYEFEVEVTLTRGAGSPAAAEWYLIPGSTTTRKVTICGGATIASYTHRWVGRCQVELTAGETVRPAALTTIAGDSNPTHSATDPGRLRIRFICQTGEG